MAKKVLLLLFFLFSPLYAGWQVDLLTVGGAILKPKDARAGFFLEYKSVLPKFVCIRPLIGAMTEEGRSLYVYAGFGIDIYLTKRIVLTPSCSPGLYFRGPHSIRLWFPLEFRSCLEIAWVLNGHARAGMSYFHLSNAHLGRKNPGFNSAAFFLSYPFGKLKGVCNYFNW